VSTRDAQASLQDYTSVPFPLLSGLYFVCLSSPLFFLSPRFFLPLPFPSLFESRLAPHLLMQSAPLCLLRETCIFPRDLSGILFLHFFSLLGRGLPLGLRGCAGPAPHPAWENQDRVHLRLRSLFAFSPRFFFFRPCVYLHFARVLGAPSCFFRFQQPEWAFREGRVLFLRRPTLADATCCGFVICYDFFFCFLVPSCFIWTPLREEIIRRTSPDLFGFFRFCAFPAHSDGRGPSFSFIARLQLVGFQTLTTPAVD